MWAQKQRYRAQDAKRQGRENRRDGDQEKGEMNPGKGDIGVPQPRGSDGLQEGVTMATPRRATGRGVSPQKALDGHTSCCFCSPVSLCRELGQSSTARLQGLRPEPAAPDLKVTGALHLCTRLRGLPQGSWSAHG